MNEQVSLKNFKKIPSIAFPTHTLNPSTKLVFIPYAYFVILNHSAYLQEFSSKWSSESATYLRK